jgi:hypothetical protein
MDTDKAGRSAALNRSAMNQALGQIDDMLVRWGPARVSGVLHRMATQEVRNVYVHASLPRLAPLSGVPAPNIGKGPGLSCGQNSLRRGWLS